MKEVELRGTVKGGMGSGSSSNLRPNRGWQTQSHPMQVLVWDGEMMGWEGLSLRARPPAMSQGMPITRLQTANKVIQGNYQTSGAFVEPTGDPPP